MVLTIEVPNDPKNSGLFWLERYSKRSEIIKGTPFVVTKNHISTRGVYYWTLPPIFHNFFNHYGIKYKLTYECTEGYDHIWDIEIPDEYSLLYKLSWISIDDVIKNF
jgi:hypothetical protein